MIKEEWLLVVNYEVSNFGRIRSLDRMCESNKRGPQIKKGKLIKSKLISIDKIGVQYVYIKKENQNIYMSLS